MKQQSFFDNPPPQSSRTTDMPPIERFQGAMLFSAVSDALGWPMEFLRPDGRKPAFGFPVTDFVKWHKVVGGKWWGYDEDILPGQYSDDTQLAIAISRCISDDGAFNPEIFAYEELPLWLQYERGGGKSIKTAARKLIGKRANWLNNFYEQRDLSYRRAGANGAAMRNLPIALVNVMDEAKLLKDSFLNAIITHGHPRAILGSMIFGLAVKYALTSTTNVSVTSCVDYLENGMEQAGKSVAHDRRVSDWIRDWEKDSVQTTFRAQFDEVRKEASGYLRNISQHFEVSPERYYALIGALKPETKGSGIGTVCAAIYLFLKYKDEPQKAIQEAVNMLGSDTDTIGVFLGALLGAYHGISVVPVHLADVVQDREYLLKIGTRLHGIANNENQEQLAEKRSLSRTDAYLRILAWEIGLHEMFWDALDVGGLVYHPSIGRGRITSKIKKPIRRDDYVVKLISINFDCGQSCVFHSRVQNDEKVSESLAEEIEKALIQ